MAATIVPAILTVVATAIVPAIATTIVASVHPAVAAVVALITTHVALHVTTHVSARVTTRLRCLDARGVGRNRRCNRWRNAQHGGHQASRYQERFHITSPGPN